MNGARHDSLISGLTADLRPVRRLAPPMLRAAVWLAAVVVVGFGLAIFADVHAMWLRLTATPDMSLAVAGAAATAVLACIAAFELSMPDARRTWALLPLPGALLWIGASGFGCLRNWLVPETHVAVFDESRDCFFFIIALSLPLSVLMILILRRAFPLSPGLTAAIAGLAVAAAAATLLNFFHPFDAAATDLAVHVVAVAIVIAANRLFAGRVLARKIYSPVM